MIRSLVVAAALLLIPSSATAADKAPGKAEQAIRASFYLNTVPTLVETVDSTKKDILDALELPPAQRTIYEKALAETWNESKLYANASAALDKKLKPEALDAGLARMTPTVQRLFKTAISEQVPPEQVKAWLAEAAKHPDAKERAALFQRIAAHMPKSKTMRALFQEMADVFGDLLLINTGADDQRKDVYESFMGGLEPMFQAMDNREAMVMANTAAYRKEPTADIKALADALDSDPSKALQAAVVESLIESAKQTRLQLGDRLKADLKAPAKKKKK